MDMQSGFWQIQMDPESKEKTAFVTADGLYQFKKLPFGLANSPACYQRMINLILSGLRWSVCLVYMDDILVYSSDFNSHLVRLEAVLLAIREAGLRIKLSKCRFAERTVKVLGHIVSDEVIQCDLEKLAAAVKDFPKPKDVKAVQSFLGLCSYYRKFVGRFAELSRPLCN